MIRTGRELRIHRRSHNIELKRFAQMMGINTEALRSIERDEFKPHPDELRKAERLLNEFSESHQQVAKDAKSPTLSIG